MLNHNIIDPCDTYIAWVLAPEYQISQPSPVAQGLAAAIVPCYPQDTADLATYNMALLWTDQLQAQPYIPDFDAVGPWASFSVLFTLHEVAYRR